MTPLTPLEPSGVTPLEEPATSLCAVTFSILDVTRAMAPVLRFAAAVLVALPVLAAPARAQRSPATESITLRVEVVTRDHTPVIACGQMGMQPRDVSARVLGVEQGSFDGDTILLSWPVCEFSHVEPGNRFRIRIRRRVGQPVTPTTRYLVRWSEPIP